MAVIEAILAVIGCLFLCLVIFGVPTKDSPPPPPVEDRAAPYREGLHVAIRMQRVAQDLEQQIYAEAARHLEDQPNGER